MRHYDVTHKWCPKNWCAHEDEWLKFKEEIEVELEMEKYGYKVYDKFEDLPEWAKESVNNARICGVLKGVGEDKLGLSLTEVKTLVWLDRCGLFNVPNPQFDDVLIGPEKE